MATKSQEIKQKLIDDILRLQQDFEALTERSNGLQHQNDYFQTQLQDLQTQLQIKLQKQRQSDSINNANQHQQQQWPLYLKIEGETLPQHPGQFVKFLGQDGRQYVQSLQLVQYVETSPDGKSQNIVRQQYMIVQQPLQMFEQNHGPFSQLMEKKQSEQKSQQLKCSQKSTQKQIQKSQV